MSGLFVLIDGSSKKTKFPRAETDRAHLAELLLLFLPGSAPLGTAKPSIVDIRYNQINEN